MNFAEFMPDSYGHFLGGATTHLCALDGAILALAEITCFHADRKIATQNLEPVIVIGKSLRYKESWDFASG